MNVSGKAKRVITVKRCFNGVTVRELILGKERINEHLLVDPKLMGFHISLELNTKEVFQWS